MDDNFNTELDEGQNEGDGQAKPKSPMAQLRELVEKQGAELKALREENAKHAAAQRAGKVSDLLKGANANPALARFVEADLKGKEPTPEAVEAWLTENAAITGWQPAEPAGEQPGGDPNDPMSVANQQARIAAATRNAPSAPREAGVTPDRAQKANFDDLVKWGWVDTD